MKFTLSWLKYHLITEASLEEITDKLSMLGLEVEEVDDRAAALSPFKIAHVTSARQHPNADRLRLCTVDAGEGEVQVVCGAPNAREGMKGVFAPSGSYIPGSDMTLKPSKIRGEESNGMLCSEREMGLSDDHEGIIELPEDAPVGENWAAWAGLDDPVIEIALTPNRGDCASVRGIARDLAAAGLGELRGLPDEVEEGAFKSPVKWLRDFPDGEGDACPAVVGRYFRNVTNGESPAFIQDRLRAIGLRPISALVDITNWLTFDLGRPLHVFDADKISGDLTMRFARGGEKLEALDERSYTLDDGMVVISDDKAVQGIGGVMGGMASGCTEETKNVFLEVALFDPIRIAEAGRKLGILSDARYRFERGIDPNSLAWGTEIATRMILKFCGGEASEVVMAGEAPAVREKKTLDPDRVKSLTGVDIPASECAAILKQLGFEPDMEDGKIDVTVPAWRPDIDGEADLIEEVLRIHGFDSIPEVPLDDGGMTGAARSQSQRQAEQVRRTLAARGLVEAVTYSFIDSDHAKHFGDVPETLKLSNPISSDLDAMRPSVLPGLLAAVARNQARGVNDPLLFEVGQQYMDDTHDGQLLVAAGMRAENAAPRHWSAPARPVDAMDAKADALAALTAAGAPVGNLQITRDAPGWYHPGRSACLRLGPNLLANFGGLHPGVLEAMEARGPVAAFEVFLDRIPTSRKKTGAAKPLLDVPALQPVHRDFAFIVDEGTEAADVLRAARNADQKLITDVALFDIYQGKGMEDGKKSLGIMVTLQPADATLTDEQIDAVGDAVVKAVQKRTGGVLRG